MKSISSITLKSVLAVVAISFSVGGFAGDMDGSVRERMHSKDGNDVTVAFARCSALLVDAAAMMKLRGVKDGDTSMQIVVEYGNFYAQQTYMALGAETNEQKIKINEELKKLSNAYGEIYVSGDTVAKARAQDDRQACFDFITDAQKKNQ